MFQERLKQSSWQIPLLIVVAGMLALGVNHWRGDGIALVEDRSAGARFADAAGAPLVIALNDAERLFRKDAALFVDARPPGQYAEGHIRGALSLPWQEKDLYFMDAMARLEASGTIITYCDGESCDLSHQLALFLKEMGFENVRVLVNGWSLWQQTGLPVETGA